MWPKWVLLSDMTFRLVTRLRGPVNKSRYSPLKECETDILGIAFALFGIFLRRRPPLLPERVCRIVECAVARLQSVAAARKCSCPTLKVTAS